MLFNKISIFDGGMGSMIEALGLDVTNVEDLNITNSLDIQKIHLSYALNGADYITTIYFRVMRSAIRNLLLSIRLLVCGTKAK